MKEKNYFFDNKAMLNMELMVLSKLKWRMQGITPFSYIDYFLNKVNGDQVPIGDSVLQSFKLILSTVRGIIVCIFLPNSLIITMMRKNEIC
jgi:cyclin D1/2/4